MINALQMYRDFQMGDREAAERSEQRGLQNQMLRFQFAQQQEQAARERQRQNMLAQAMSSGNPNALMMADPKLGFQMQQMQSKERMARERMTVQERIAAERNRVAQERANQPIWDAERGVFIQRPQPGMAPPGGGIITPQGLPPRRNPEAEKLQAKAAFQLPEALNQGEMALKQLEDMIGTAGRELKPGEKERAPHKGFTSAVGATWLPGARFIEGSDTADFMARLNQAKGGAFLQAFEALKGGGQITEIEGKKATEAITRMDKAQSEKEFIKAAREFESVIRQAMENAKRQASGGGKPGAAPAAGSGQFRVLGVEGK